MFALGITDPNLPFKSMLFEVFSAFGTVGLDLGVTSRLSDGGKMVIILMMYIGRMGVVAVFTTFLRRKMALYTYPVEDIVIG